MGVTRGLDRIDLRAAKRRTYLAEDADGPVDRVLLDFGQPVPPVAELVGELDFPHVRYHRLSTILVNAYNLSDHQTELQKTRAERMFVSHEEDQRLLVGGGGGVVHGGGAGGEGGGGGEGGAWDDWGGEGGGGG